MKHQYFGDIHDYRKYGLLRALQLNSGGRLLVAWMLTPDDARSDGRFRSYLEASDKWAVHDPVLFAGLARLHKSAHRRSVSLIEASELLPRTSYHSTLVPDLRPDRDAWRNELIDKTSGVDLVFLDPDNGIEVRSKPVGRKGSCKYVTWHEVEAVWKANCSLLIYQHFPREERDVFIQRRLCELGERTSSRFTAAFRTPHVLFLLAVQDRHARQYGDAIGMIKNSWNGQIELVRRQ